MGWRHGSDAALLWLWYRPAATAPNAPLDWEPPYATGAAVDKTTTKTNNIGVPIVAQWLMNPIRNHEVEGSIPGLA